MTAYAFVTNRLDDACKCSFGVQPAYSGAGISGDTSIPFIVDEDNLPVTLILPWGVSHSATGGLEGRCYDGSGYSSGVSGVFRVAIQDAFGSAVYSEGSDAHEPAHRYYKLTLYLRRGQYSLWAYETAGAGVDAVAVISTVIYDGCLDCSAWGGGSMASSLAVMLIANRTTIQVPLEAVLSDVDGNYRVDDGDLLSVLAEFGNDGHESLADINCNGHVDDADLLMVLQYFGTEY